MRGRSGACLPRVIPSMFGHCFGAYATPGGRLVLLLLRLSENLFGKNSAQNADEKSFRTFRKCRTSALGVAPTR